MEMGFHQAFENKMWKLTISVLSGRFSLLSCFHTRKFSTQIKKEIAKVFSVCACVCFCLFDHLFFFFKTTIRINSLLWFRTWCFQNFRGIFINLGLDLKLLLLLFLTSIRGNYWLWCGSYITNPKLNTVY